MLVIFGNQKGGAGKSTLALLFANYITLVKKRKAIVLDMDYQRTLLTRYEEAKILENPELYEVVEVELENFPSVLYILNGEPQQLIIIDLPGRLDDDELIPVIQAADIFIIPFSYDKATYQSTAMFTLIANELNPESVKFFIPNRIKGTVRYETAEAINRDFSKHGKITATINDRVDFQRLNTRDLPVQLLPMIERVFEDVLIMIDNG